MTRRVNDFLMSHRELSLGQSLVQLQALQAQKTDAPDQLFRTTFDGNGIGYPLIATAALRIFGLHAWAPLCVMLGLMALASAAFLWRFGASLAYVVTLYFAALTALLFTAIVWEPVFRTQIPVSGIRYFSLVAVLPTLHILLHLFARETVERRQRRRDYALLGVQAAVLTIAVLVRSSAASLFGAILIAWLIQLWRSDRLGRPLGNAAIIGAVVAAVGITLVLAMPKEYVTEGRIGTVVWHRAVVSLDLNPAYPFPGLSDMFADCRERLPPGVRRGGGDFNAGCIWIDYQVKHGLPIDGLGLDLYNGKYEKVLEKQFFKIAARYPSEVLATFLYYKPQSLLPAIKAALRTNFANDPKRTAVRDDKSYVPYPTLAIGLLIAVLAIGAFHMAITATANLVIVAGVVVWTALWTLPPYIVAWPGPHTIADFNLYCLLLLELAFGGVVACARHVAGRYARASGVPA